MKFTQLESIMVSRGVNTLAEIARSLNTTPQAVSNWKARDQVPYHIVALVNETISNNKNKESFQSSGVILEEETAISLSDIFLTMAEQLKVIFLVLFISVFITFTYTQFIKAPKYVSWATVLIPDNKAGSMGGLSGLASQFGVNVPNTTQADLSSPSLFPELLRSRTFAEKILSKEFYTKKYGKKLTLLAILTHGDNPPEFDREKLITIAIQSLNEVMSFEQDPTNTFSVIKVTAPEAILAKELADVVLMELEDLNRYFKDQSSNEKIIFINNRISSVEGDLKISEQILKEFKEQNRQISSPALQLEQERLARNVEIKSEIYLTLKQQLELAKIEEVQKASIVQVLDEPVIAVGPSNINLVISVMLSVVVGLGFGIFLGFCRAYINNSEVSERRKIRRIRNFIKKKGKDVILDLRISATVSILLILGLPFYLNYESQNPVFFNRYSIKLMIIISIYILTLITSSLIFINLYRKKRFDRKPE